MSESPTAHKHRPLPLPAWECLQAVFWPCVPECGEGEQLTGALASLYLAAIVGARVAPWQALPL